MACVVVHLGFAICKMTAVPMKVFFYLTTETSQEWSLGCAFKGEQFQNGHRSDECSKDIVLSDINQVCLGECVVGRHVNFYYKLISFKRWM